MFYTTLCITTRLDRLCLVEVLLHASDLGHIFAGSFCTVRQHPLFVSQDCGFHAEMWWDLSLTDPAAKSQLDSMLATKYGFLMMKPGIPFDLDGPTTTTLRLEALQATQRAIEDPNRCYSVGVITAITASVFEAVSDWITLVLREPQLIWS